MNTDKLTQYLKIAFEILVLHSPVRGSLGLFFGYGAFILSKIFAPALESLSFIDMSRIDPWEFMLLGFLVFHIPTAIAFISTSSKLDEATEQAFESIRTAEKEGLPDSHKVLLLREICQRVLKNVELKEQTRQEIAKLDI